MTARFFTKSVLLLTALTAKQEYINDTLCF